MSTPPGDRWTQLEALVDSALDLSAADRPAFLREACGGDAELLRSAEAWLAACEDPALFPESPAVVFGAPILGGGESSPNAEPRPGSRIGPYRIIRELGRGGMGTVFLAERGDGQFDQQVALKLMRRGTGFDPHLRRRFLEERQILARLEHPHIAALLDGGVTADGQPFFVMRYVDGTPIDRYCDERSLSVEARLRLFLTVCAAVQHAHRHRVVHRDLKPSNILVTADGQARLLDFGIAKLLEPDSALDGAGITRTAERLLTPEFASPEQIRGAAVSPASDVYSLGVLLHRLLTGGTPYGATPRTPHEIERAILEVEPAPPSLAIATPGTTGASTTQEVISHARATTPDRLRRRLRGDLDAIVLTCLLKEPAARYADAGELAEDVRRHLDREPISVRTRAPLYRVRSFGRRHRVSLAAATAGIIIGSAFFAAWSLGSRPPGGGAGEAHGGTPILAIGRITDHRENQVADAAAPLADMLATNLARTDGLSVVSGGRMYELLNRLDAEPAEQDYTRAARLAGASEIVNGAIYATADGGIRLDLRRVDVASGNIKAAHTASGADLFALADSATVQLVARLGLAAPRGSIAAVTTRSLAAYGLYTDGLKHFYAGERTAAVAAFEAALTQDSTFAMAAYYVARASGYEWRFVSATSAERAQFGARIERALRLADQASDRERLTIRTWYALFHLAPEMGAVAETLAVRYPREIDGHLMLGVSRELEGNLPAALVHFERVLAMDSSAVRVAGDRCVGCVALEGLIEAYALLDSLEVAERHARTWLRRQPASSAARDRLVQILDARGQIAEATALLKSRPAQGPVDSVVALAKHAIRIGELAQADTMLAGWAGRVDGASRAPLLFFRAVVLRNQGRLVEALVVARRLRRDAGGEQEVGAAPPAALVEAQTLLELGQVRAAAALFDSIGRWPARGQPLSVQAMFRVQAVTMLAATLYAGGDTATLRGLADSLEADGQRTLMFRPRDQHLFVRALLHAARGDEDAAIAALERALRQIPSDFARANLQLASLHLQRGHARAAIDVLRPAALGWFLETSNLHVMLTEVHEQLARAWEQAGVPDSAAAHWARVARDWEFADPRFAQRRQHAVTRAAALSRPPRR